MSQLDWCYEVFELHGDCSWSAIQESYDDLLIVWNPDRFTEHPRIQAQVIQKQKILIEAYTYLQTHHAIAEQRQASATSKWAGRHNIHPAPPTSQPIRENLSDQDDNLLALQELKPERCYIYAPVDLRWCDLSGQVFTGVNWCGATLIGAKLEDANLEGANLCQANLWQANLLRVNLNDAQLVGANLREAHLQRANLRGTVLEGAIFKRANLEGADLSNADLQDAVFVDANLRGAFLGQVNLQGVSLKGADLSGAILNGRQLPEGSIY